MPVFPALTLRERADALAHRIGFERAQHVWIRTRLDALASVPASTPPAMPRRPHVVVVPQEGRAFASFAPGTRNFHFEAWRSLAETAGEASVTVFDVEPGEDAQTWHRRLLDTVREVDATHVITHIESDPGSQVATWTWDDAWALLSVDRDGVLLGFMFDFAFEWSLPRLACSNESRRRSWWSTSARIWK